MKQEQFLDRVLPLQPRLQQVAERLLGSEAEAEDTVQEVVADLWERRDALDRVVNFEAYAMQALKHRCLSLLRSRRPTVDVEALPDITDDEAAREAALVEERAARLDALMLRLPQAQRDAIRMRYIDGLPHAEMQRRLGMSSSNVYTTLSRGVSALKAMIRL